MALFAGLGLLSFWRLRNRSRYRYRASFDACDLGRQFHVSLKSQDRFTEVDLISVF